MHMYKIAVPSQPWNYEETDGHTASLFHDKHEECQGVNLRCVEYAHIQRAK